VLTQSLSGAIRWRFLDYGQLLTKQLKLLAGPEHALRQTDVASTGRDLGSWKQP
jgi:hypothetical protein